MKDDGGPKTGDRGPAAERSRRPLVVGIDASRASVPRRTGTEAYALHLTRALIALDSPHAFRLYFRDDPAPGLLPRSERVEHRVIPFPRLWTHARLSWEMARRPPDVLFIPAHVLPLIHPAASAVTVHDLGYLHFPEAHPLGQRLYLDWSTRFSARRAARVIADSRATRDDLISRYGIPAEKIAIVYPGRDESLAPVEDPARLAEVRKRYGLPGRFLLHVGTVQPRKNLARLLDAFCLIRDRAPGLGLVLAGRRGWLAGPIVARVKALGLESAVRFLDYVADDDLPALYSAAALYVFPSLYEGFGFTPLEAMACGTPVVCSEASSLPEVVGQAARLVSPADAGDIAAACLDLLADAEARRALVARGFEQVRRLSWTRCAAETLKVLEATTS